MIVKMSAEAVVKFVFLFAVFSISLVQCDRTWPVPYQTVDKRPMSNPYCEAGVAPFCPTGRANNTMPRFNSNDTLYVYAMKAPVWEFKFGDLLEKFDIMHDAMGFHHVQSGANFTMEWYELYQLFNCTFPHLLANDSLLWCNQGAACIYNGVDEIHWKQNGTLVKVAEITGDTFNKFANWTETDNNTAVFYETWTVKQKPGDQSPHWFEAWECASWVIRAFGKLHDFGATFNQSVHLNYTRMNLYSHDEPILLGNASTVFRNKELAKELTTFYRKFQSHQSMPHLIESLLEAFMEVVVEGKFFLFYNQQYWQLKPVNPYFEITYHEVPLPKNVTAMTHG